MAVWVNEEHCVTQCVKPLHEFVIWNHIKYCHVIKHCISLHFQVGWTLSQDAAATEASTLICVAAFAKMAGLAKTARSPVAQMTAPVRVCVSKGSVSATVTLVATTVQSPAAPLTARAAVCVSTESACAKSPSQAKTAWSEGVLMTARIRGCALTGPASAGLVMWEKTAHWCTAPTTAARRGSARRASVYARMGSLEMTVTQVS